MKSLSLSHTHTQMQQKAGFADLDGSFIEIDYTSQQEKDLDKRRRHLFRLILANNAEYLFQAPSENQMLQWYKTHTHQSLIYKVVQGPKFRMGVVDTSLFFPLILPRDGNNVPREANATSYPPLNETLHTHTHSLHYQYDLTKLCTDLYVQGI